MCNGPFEDKDPNEAIEYLDLLAENAQKIERALFDLGASVNLLPYSVFSKSQSR